MSMLMRNLLLNNTRTPLLGFVRTKMKMKGRTLVKVVKKPEVRPQLFKYFLILDFEATCEKGFDNPKNVVQEIIEFPVLKMNAETLEVEAQFHEFVQPRINPELSNFCHDLTGIIQQDIDASAPFPRVLSRFEGWLSREVGEAPALVVTSGEWDLLKCMPLQCALEAMPLPEYFQTWHNVKKSYCQAVGDWPTTLRSMVEGLDLNPVGRPHRGMDDCHNIANIVAELVRNRDRVLVPTTKVPKIIQRQLLQAATPKQDFSAPKEDSSGI